MILIEFFSATEEWELWRRFCKYFCSNTCALALHNIPCSYNRHITMNLHELFRHFNHNYANQTTPMQCMNHFCQQDICRYQIFIPCTPYLHISTILVLLADNHFWNGSGQIKKKIFLSKHFNLHKRFYFQQF